MNFKKVRVKTEEVIISRTTQTIEIDFDFTQLYDCFYTLTFGLKSPRSFQLLFYMLKGIGNNNVSVSGKLFQDFNKEIVHHEGQGISEQTFYKCIKELEAAKLITKVSRGNYFINPHVLWKEDQNKRTDFIKADPYNQAALAYNPVKLLDIQEGRYTE